MDAPTRSVKVTIVVTDHVGLYEDKERARVQQEFPAATATLATIGSWATRTAANALRDAARSFPLPPAPADDPLVPVLAKPLGELTDADAVALSDDDPLPF